jgi:hypothetical protein
MNFVEFKVWILLVHLVFPNMQVEVFEMAHPTQDACQHFLSDVTDAFKAIDVEVVQPSCTEQTWYYEDGSV